MTDQFRPSAALPRVSAITTIDDLVRLGPAYAALLTQIPDARGLFYVPERLRIMAPHYLPDRSHQLLFLLAWRDDRLIGVAPLMTIRQGWRQCFIRRVNFWGAEPGPMRMEGDFLIPDVREAAPCLQAFFKHLRHRASRIDHIDLRYFRGSSSCRPAFEMLDSLQRLRQEDMVTHRALLPAGFEQYCGTLGKSVTAKSMNRMRAVQRDLSAELHCLEHLDDDTLAQVASLHTARQQLLSDRGRSRHAVFERDQPTVTALLRLMEETGQARHYLLKSGSRVIAFALGFHAQGTWFYWLTAFDSQLSRYEPGRVLMLMLIREEIERFSTVLIDMMAGTTKIKLDFGNQVISHDHCAGPGSAHVVSSIKRKLSTSVRGLKRQGRTAGRQEQDQACAGDDISTRVVNNDCT